MIYYNNICQLQTSHHDLDLMDRIKKAIPNQLSYARSFWAEHRQFAAIDADILKEVKDFLRWLEVLSLIKKVITPLPALILISEW